MLIMSQPTDALALLRGEVLTVDPPVRELGEAPPGTRRQFPIRLVNHTDQPIQVVGGTTSCSCTVTGPLPVTVPPYGAQVIEVQMVFPVGQVAFSTGSSCTQIMNANG
jgi:hypothetical protein